MTLRLVYDKDTEAVLRLIADLRYRIEQLSPDRNTVTPCPSTGFAKVPRELVGFDVHEDAE